MSYKNPFKKYGITEDQYWALHAKQNGLCACCGEAETNIIRGRVQRLSIEHDHKTGKIRALTCNRCNVIVGLCRESVGILIKIINYIRKYC